GSIRAVTPEGLRLEFFEPVSPNAKSVVGFADGKFALYSIESDAPPRPLPGLAPPDMPLQWSEDGRSMLVRDFHDAPIVSVFRLALASGKRQLWKPFSVNDPSGIETIEPIVITPDARSYCFTYSRTLAQLQVVEGLQ